MYICVIEYYSAMEKNKSCHSCSLDRPRGYGAKWSKSDKGRQIPWLHLYVESNKTKQNKTNEQRNRNGLINTENQLAVARGKGWAI